MSKSERFFTNRMNSVVGIGKSGTSLQCELIYGIRRHSEHNSISKKNSVIGTGSTKMILECEPTYVIRLLPKLEEINKNHSHKNEYLPLKVQFRLF